MGKSLAQPISRPVHLGARPSTSDPTAPDIVAAVRAFIEPDGANTTTMSAYGFPVFLRHGLEAIARKTDRTMQRTVAAALGLGLPLLHRFPGMNECLEARQELIRNSRDPHVHRWLEQVVAVDLPTAGLGHTRFVVRVAVAQHGQIGLIAGALGLLKGECFTLALTAALLGSPCVPMEEANAAMYRTLVDLRRLCEARARDTETLLHLKQPDTTTVRRTIDDVLANPGW